MRPATQRLIPDDLDLLTETVTRISGLCYDDVVSIGVGIEIDNHWVRLSWVDLVVPVSVGKLICYW
jgi:hypothetical protein